MAKSRREFLRGICSQAMIIGSRPMHFIVADSREFLGLLGEVKVLQFYGALDGGGGS